MIKKAKIQKGPQAPGQFLGFSLQETRFLARLLEAKPGYAVSLEVFGDVGVETEDGGKITEESKSVTDAGNPISDRALGLWKTLSNWIDAVECGDLELDKTIFEIYVSKPKIGNIAKMFSDARSFQEAKRSLLEARRILWGEEPDFKLKSTISNTIEPYASKVFNTKYELVCKIIEAFSFNCGSGCSNNDIRDLMKSKFVPAEIMDEVLIYAQGWIKNNIILLLETKKPATIKVDDFIYEITKYIRTHDRRTILKSFAKEPRREEIDQEIKLKTYVRQLEIIDCEYDEIIRAVRDFLQSSVDRTEWSVKGWVLDSSFIELDNSLIRAWENHKTMTNIKLMDRDDLQKGRYLYSECIMHQATIEGLEIPNHFVPGSFHALAEEKIVGWHPNYKTKLEELEDMGT